MKRNEQMYTIILIVVLTLGALALGVFFPIALVTVGILLASLAMLGAALLIVFWLLPYVPFAIALLANDPNRNRHDDEEFDRVYEPSTFGFFTSLQPGQVKIIERNQRFIRCIMRFDGHTFAGSVSGAHIPRNSERFWEVIETPRGGRDFHPIVEPWKYDIDETGKSIERQPKWLEKLFYRWCRRVYDITGFVFTGIYPFQTVRVYPMDRYKLDTDDLGYIRSKMKQDYSDHYRVEDFQFGVVVPRADTKDKVPVSITQNFIGRVANPYEAAYSTDDDWGARLLSIIADAVTNATRSEPLDNILSATNKRSKDRVKKAVLAIEIKPKPGQTEEDLTKGIRAFGFKAIDTYILDVSTTDPNYAEGLADLAKARVDRDAKIERAKGLAAEVGLPAAEAEKYNVFGEISLRNRGMVDAAKAAGDKAIVMLGNNPTSTDPLVAKVERNTRKDK